MDPNFLKTANSQIPKTSVHPDAPEAPKTPLKPPQFDHAVSPPKQSQKPVTAVKKPVQPESDKTSKKPRKVRVKKSPKALVNPPINPPVSPPKIASPAAEITTAPPIQKSYETVIRPLPRQPEPKTRGLRIRK